MKTITATTLDGQGMPKEITAEVPDNATEQQIREAIEKAARNA